MVLACSVRADMVQVYSPNAVQQEYSYISSHPNNVQKDFVGVYENPVSIVTNFDLKVAQFPNDKNAGIEQSPQKSPALELKGEPGSFSLCLYALMGFGLCSAPHWFRRLSFSDVPDWYHTGGPYQVGHSFAITPDFHHTAPVLHFLQPEIFKEDYIPRYRTGIIVSLWRESQFTLEKIASRAPPFIA